MITRRFAALSVATMTVLAMVIVLVQAGCGGPSKRARTLQTVLVSVNAARDGFAEFDRQQQQHVLEAAPTREEYLAEIEAYKKARQPVLEYFEVAYRALAVAALQHDEVSLKRALDEVADLIAAVNKLTGKGP
jgi:hypothetical protein